MKLSKEYNAIANAIYLNLTHMKRTPQDLKSQFEAVKDQIYKGDFERAVKHCSFKMMRFWPQSVDTNELNDSHIHTVHRKFFTELLATI